MNPVVRFFWQRHGLTALLGIMALGCLIAIGLETGWWQSLRLALPASNNSSRTNDMVATLPGFGLPPLDSAFKETGERPLFTPARRPAPVNLASAPAMKRGQFKLSGTSVNNEMTVAFLLETATGKTVRVVKGKEINGMILDTVEANRAVLKLGDETEELVLRTASSPPVSRVIAPTPGSVPAGPVAPNSGAPPVAAIGNETIPQAPPRPAMPQTAATPSIGPAPGSSVMPGFVMPAGPAATPSVPSAETGNPGQRRRRNPAAQPQ